MKKGLTYTDLMLLKRVPNQTGPQWRPVNGKGEGIISRLGSGLCFDFAASVGDTANYYVGTEDGVIHKCSVSYNEQYLQNYHGHTGPIYKLRCHPLNPNVFLSCSADWTIKLWDQSKPESILTFQQMDLTDVVNDIVWAPENSTVFASVTADGRVEIWDVSQTTLYPVIAHHSEEEPVEEEPVEEEVSKKPSEGAESDSSDFSDEEQPVVVVEPEESKEPPVLVKKQLSVVRFAKDPQVLVTGDSNGSVDVFKVVGMFNTERTLNRAIELDRLSKAMQPDPMNKQ
jgi:WD40 repeat protein